MSIMLLANRMAKQLLSWGIAHMSIMFITGKQDPGTTNNSQILEFRVVSGTD